MKTYTAYTIGKLGEKLNSTHPTIRKDRLNKYQILTAKLFDRDKVLYFDGKHKVVSEGKVVDKAPLSPEPSEGCVAIEFDFYQTKKGYVKHTQYLPANYQVIEV